MGMAVSGRASNNTILKQKNKQAVLIIEPCSTYTLKGSGTRETLAGK